MPKVNRCFFDHSFEPPLPAMELRWDPDAAEAAPRTWYFPHHVFVQGPAPDRCGVTIHRQAEDHYQVRILWNQLSLSWEGLTRMEIMTCSLAPILKSLGTNLWYLLNQPIADDGLRQAA